MATEFAIKRLRKKQGEGRDPLLHTRAPAPLVALVQAKAAARKVAISAIVREALAQYVGEEDRAA
jgi:Ribbon-helix-helix protein, copG family